MLGVRSASFTRMTEFPCAIAIIILESSRPASLRGVSVFDAENFESW